MSYSPDGSDMGVARMRKVHIFASRELGEAVLETLRDLELFQVKATKAEDSVSQASYQDTLQKLVSIKTYLEQYNPFRRGFIDMFIGTKPEVTYDEFRKMVEEEDVDSVYAQVTAHENRQKQIAQRIGEIDARKQALEPWRSLDVSLAGISGTESCDGVLAVVSASKWAEKEQEMADQPVHWRRVWQKQDDLGIWLLSLRDGYGPSSSMVSDVGGSVVDLSQGAKDTDRTPDQEVLALGEELDALVKEKEQILQEDHLMSKDLIKMLALMDYYLDKKNLSEIRDKVEGTTFTLVMEGFVRAKDVGRLRSALSGFREIEIVDEEPDEGEDIPIYLENPPLIRPFESVTNIFGFPHYQELDPTPWLAPFFWVYFGITLGDVFYGIILASICYWLLRTKKQLSDGGKKLVTLLLYSSFSMIIVGVLTGSWFGDLASVFAPGTAFDRFVARLTLLNPVSDPLTLMVISLAFGVFQIWVGLGVKAIALARSGQVSEAIIAQVPWLLFLPGLVAWGLSKVGMIQSDVPFYAMIVGALGIMYSSSRGQKNILLKPFAGAYGLYGSISYLADTLSYTRLLALGLSSAIIAVVINKIANLVATMIPVVGWVLVPLVLVVGHAFNLVINLLGSFIHSGRLQFIEFFTKFFEGGGRPFRPLKRVSENVSLRSD